MNYPKPQNVKARLVERLVKIFTEGDFIEIDTCEEKIKDVDFYGARRVVQVNCWVEYNGTVYRADAVSVCNPIDNYSWPIGASLAFKKAATLLAQILVEEVIKSNKAKVEAWYKDFGADIELTPESALYISYLVAMGRDLEWARRFVISGQFEENMNRRWNDAGLQQ